MPKLHSTRPSAVFTAMLLGAGLLSTLTSVAVGCASDPAEIPMDEGAGGSGGGAASSASGGAFKDPEEMFRALEKDLVNGCGTCHSGGDTNFLAGPDAYKSIAAWRGIVMKDWRKSKLLTIPVQNGGHEGGKNLDSPSVPADLLSRVEAWLEAEAAAIVKPDPEDDGGVVTGPSIDPITPVMGFNAVYLDSLGTDFEGMAITFFADAPTPNLLMLTDVQIHATSDTGLHVVHPLFVVYPKGVEADPDPVDSCSNVDQTLDVGGTAELGPGTMVLANWKEEAKLGVVFEKVEPYLPGGPVVDDGCKNVDAFIANAVGPLQNNCATACHGGANGQANNAVDMSKLQDDPAAACGQVLNRVKPEKPEDSQIFLVTTPNNNTGHPFKLTAGNFDGFRTAVSTWITAEANAAGQ